MSQSQKRKYNSKQWIGCPIEEEYFGDERKASKKERKIASASDRSKNKKTDRDKRQKVITSDDEKFSREGLCRGLVLSIAPEGITVRGDTGDTLCVLRGVLKKVKQQVKNLIVVGDIVLYELLEGNQGAIAHIEPRRTQLSRADNLSRRKEQLIAANIDQVIITGSVVLPALKPALLDRYVIAARRGGLDPIIVINKIDLLKDANVESVLQESEKELFEHLLSAYQQLGFPVIPISTHTGEGLDLLAAIMKDKSSVFSGQSGVGKSSLINALIGSDLRVGAVVDKTRKGAHTTTNARLLPLKCGGWCVDTPGIKSFGIWDLKKDEIEQYFSEIHRIGRQCHYPDCSHFQEEDCAVRQAVDNGEISVIRYSSYISLMLGSDEEHRRR